MLTPHGISFSPRNALIVGAGRYVAQKLLAEYDARNAWREAQAALNTAKATPDVPERVLDRVKDNVRLAEEALAVACAAVDGCIIDFTETIRETMRGEAGPAAMDDATAAAIVEESTERRHA